MKPFFTWILCFVFLQPTAFPSKAPTAPPLITGIHAVIYPEKRELEIAGKDPVDTVLLMLRRLPFAGSGYMAPPPFTRGCDLHLLLSDGTTADYQIRGFNLQRPGKKWEQTDKEALGLLYFLLEYYSAQNASLHSKQPGLVFN